VSAVAITIIVRRNLPHARRDSSTLAPDHQSIVAAPVSRKGIASRLTNKTNRVSSRTQSRAFSFPPHFGGRGTQRGICFSFGT